MKKMTTKRRDSYHLVDLPPNIYKELGIKDRDEYRKSDLWKMLIDSRLVTANQKSHIELLKIRLKQAERLMTVAVVVAIVALFLLTYSF